MGVQIERITPGDGKASRLGGILRSGAHNNKVKIHYIGKLKNADKWEDMSKFDSSRDRGSPFETQIGIGRVIKGWDEGVPQLSLGEKAKLTITPDYGYGARGHSPVIPPNATLIFEVELLAIN
ncbi:hypothetical protein FRC06_007118 [Ceratobasidium sp. 370]|nr:hypothetical protein FRC06_007118 [Ceratobasidium sp. 370]